jgi:hypothetical protein
VNPPPPTRECPARGCVGGKFRGPDFTKPCELCKGTGRAPVEAPSPAKHTGWCGVHGDWDKPLEESSFECTCGAEAGKP